MQPQYIRLLHNPLTMDIVLRYQNLNRSFPPFPKIVATPNTPYTQFFRHTGTALPGNLGNPQAPPCKKAKV